MRISDWSSDVCSSDLIGFRTFAGGLLAGVGSLLVLVFNGVMFGTVAAHLQGIGHGGPFWRFVVGHAAPELSAIVVARSEEHTSELQSLMRISYAVFCLKKKRTITNNIKKNFRTTITKQLNVMIQ